MTNDQQNKQPGSGPGDSDEVTRAGTKEDIRSASSGGDADADPSAGDVMRAGTKEDIRSASADQSADSDPNDQLRAGTKEDIRGGAGEKTPSRPEPTDRLRDGS
jgi:hypothetical protein